MEEVTKDRTEVAGTTDTSSGVPDFEDRRTDKSHMNWGRRIGAAVYDGVPGYTYQGTEVLPSSPSESEGTSLSLPRTARPH